MCKLRGMVVNREEKIKRIKKIEKLLIMALILVFVGGLSVNGVVNSLLGKINITDKFSKGDVIVEESLMNKEKETDVINIAIFGVDNRDDDYETENSRTDAMKILSLNFKNKKVSLTSLQRDMLIYIPEPINDFDKLNHPYWYGGPELALKTINHNFDLDLTRYVTVNFSGVEGIINLMDGVLIDVLPNEVSGTNQWIADLDNNAGKGENTKKLQNSGPQVLNGRQALGYMRNRNVGSDYERMNRQTKVMNAMVNQMKTIDFTEILPLLNESLQYVETNIQKSEMIDLGFKSLGLDLTEIGQYQIPVNGFDDTKSVSYNGYSPLYVNRSYQSMVKQVHFNIYGDETYEPTMTIIENESSIYDRFGRVE